jgi:hypothetical protein
VECFKHVQQQLGGAQRTLHFPECKQVIYQFLVRGPDLLQQQQQEKKKEIVQMHHKIGRNSQTPGIWLNLLELRFAADF